MKSICKNCHARVAYSTLLDKWYHFKAEKEVTNALLLRKVYCSNPDPEPQEGVFFPVDEGIYAGTAFLYKGPKNEKPT